MTEGNRGVWLITPSRTAVAHALDVFQHDLYPAKHRDLIRWAAGHPTYGAPPPGFTPDYSPGGDTSQIAYPIIVAIETIAAFEVILSPENSLRDSDSLLGMVVRAGSDDTDLVQQMYEYPYWGPSDGNPTADLNPRLGAYIDAARRGAEGRILLDSFYDDPGHVRSNVATCAYVNANGELVQFLASEQEMAPWYRPRRSCTAD